MNYFWILILALVAAFFYFKRKQPKNVTNDLNPNSPHSELPDYYRPKLGDEIAYLDSKYFVVLREEVKPNFFFYDTPDCKFTGSIFISYPAPHVAHDLIAENYEIDGDEMPCGDALFERHRFAVEDKIVYADEDHYAVWEQDGRVVFYCQNTYLPAQHPPLIFDGSEDFDKVVQLVQEQASNQMKE